MQLATERTRLHVDGVRSPISADVARRRDDGMVVMQPLPFLKLDTTVTERGRRSRIRRVAIAMDGDVPRLLLELTHDRAAASEDDTLESLTPGVSTRPARTDSTVPYGFDGPDDNTPRASIVVGAPDVEQPAQQVSAAVVVTPPESSWWSRVWRAVARALATFTAPASS